MKNIKIRQNKRPASAANTYTQVLNGYHATPARDHGTQNNSITIILRYLCPIFNSKIDR